MAKLLFEVGQTALWRCALLLCGLALFACGGEGGGPNNRTVTITWDANRQSGVNRPGGGYEVAINGQPTKNVPYTAGGAAPTSTTVQLMPGNYVVTVRAYAAFDPQGGNNQNFSAAAHLILNIE